MAEPSVVKALPVEGPDNECKVKTDHCQDLRPQKGLANRKVNIILDGYGNDVGKLGPKFEEQQIDYNNLSELCDEDLELLGVKRPAIRKEMLTNFRDLPNQFERYENVLASTDLTKYNEYVLNRISEHILNLKSALSAAQMKLYIQPSDDIVIGNQMYASDIVLTALDEIGKTVSHIERQLLDLKEGKSDEDKSKMRRVKRRLFNGILGIGTVALCGLIVCKFSKKYLPDLV